MTTRRAWMFAALGCLGAAPAVHAEDDELITMDDVPADAPRFEEYPAQVYTGPLSRPYVQSHPRSRTLRTLLTRWAKQRPNFAGHYIVATSGWGVGGSIAAIIDARTGRVFHPDGIRFNNVSEVDSDVLDAAPPVPGRDDFGALHYRADSKLLVLFGRAEGDVRRRGISWFVWQDDRLSLLRFVRKR